MLHGGDDQIVPIDNAGRLSIKLVRNHALKPCPGLPHRVLATNAELLSADLLAFVRG